MTQEVKTPRPLGGTAFKESLGENINVELYYTHTRDGRRYMIAKIWEKEEREIEVETGFLKPNETETRTRVAWKISGSAKMETPPDFKQATEDAFKNLLKEMNEKIKEEKHKNAAIKETREAFEKIVDGTDFPVEEYKNHVVN